MADGRVVSAAVTDARECAASGCAQGIHSGWRWFSSRALRGTDPPRASVAVEALEPRLFLSATRTIGGHVFADLIVGKHNRHVRKPLAGVEMILSPANGGANAASRIALTDRQGHFVFRKIVPGPYGLTEVPPTGYAPESPAETRITVKVAKRSASGLKFTLAPATSQISQGSAKPSTAPPQGALDAAQLSNAGSSAYRFSVTWTDAAPIDTSSFGDQNVLVTGPNGYSQFGNLVRLDSTANGSPRTATYQVLAPAGGWTSAANGTYTIALQAGQVRDTVGNVDPAGVLGTFGVSIDPAAPAAPLLLNSDGDITAADNNSPAKALAVRIDDAPAGAQLTLLADGQSIGSATATTGGTTLTSDGQTALANGPHVLQVVETIAGDAPMTSAPLAITVDTLPPTATLTASPITSAGASSYTFSVAYADDADVSVDTLAGAALVVTGPAGYRQTPVLASIDSNTSGPMRVAVYRVPAPGGSWTSAANGGYTISLLSGRVSDVVGNITPGRALGLFAVSIGVALSPAPGAPMLLPASDSGAYSNDHLTNFDNSTPARALQVEIPGTAPGAQVTLFADGMPIGSAEASGDSTLITTTGSYALSGGAHEITARQIAPGLGESGNSDPLGVVVDTQPPTAESHPPDVSGSGATNYQFLAVYHDDISLNVSSFDSSDIVVDGPDGFSEAARFVSVDEPYNGMPRTATYAITPPGGAWSAADNGTYAIALQGGQVFDSAGNAATPGVIGTFNVNAAVPTTAAPGAPALLPASDTGASSSDGLTNLNNSSAAQALAFSVPGAEPGATVTVYADGLAIGASVAGGNVVVVNTNGLAALSDGPHVITARQTLAGEGQSADSAATTITIDTAPPAAAGLAAADVTSAGGPSYAFSVTYVDNIGVDLASLNGSEIVITAPDGSTFGATLVGVSSSAPASPLTATYQFTPPGGSWQYADDGSYTIVLQAAHVLDSAGNVAAAQTLGTFSISVPQPITPDPGPPSLSAASDSGASQNDDITNLNNSSATPLTFVVPDTAPGATVTLYADGNPVGAAVADSDDTTIVTKGNVPLADGVHQFTASQESPGEAPSATSAALGVTVDTAPPAASALSVSDVSSSGAASYTFTVTYVDSVAVNAASFGNGNIVVSGPGGFSAPATLVAIDESGNGTPRTVTYQFVPPGGAWSAADDGAYALVLPVGQIADVAGNLNAAQSLGAFNVSIPTPTSPAPAAPVLAQASDSGVSSSDAITNFNNASAASALQFTVDQTATGATVTLYADGVPLTAAVATGTNTTLTTRGDMPLAEGVHQFTARQQLPGAAQSADSAALSVTIDLTPPTAAVVSPDLTASGQASYSFTITWSDNTAVDASSLGNGNVIVTGPNGFSAPATLASLSSAVSGSPLTATYAVAAPNGTWQPTDNATCAIMLQPAQVADVAGNTAPPSQLATFNVNIVDTTTSPTGSMSDQPGHHEKG